MKKLEFSLYSQLGERNAVLFMQDAAKVANLSELPDSFFDLSVKDIKLLIKELRNQAEGTVEQPLMTAKLREMEEEQKQLSQLNRYKTVIIRIQFPNRYVLQGTFTPYETVGTVTEFVRSYLASADVDFYLCKLPFAYPKLFVVERVFTFILQLRHHRKPYCQESLDFLKPIVYHRLFYTLARKKSTRIT